MMSTAETQHHINTDPSSNLPELTLRQNLSQRKKNRARGQMKAFNQIPASLKRVLIRDELMYCGSVTND